MEFVKSVTNDTGPALPFILLPPVFFKETTRVGSQRNGINFVRKKFDCCCACGVRFLCCRLPRIEIVIVSGFQRFSIDPLVSEAYQREVGTLIESYDLRIYR